MTYSEKLKDPRWQKKRLEILERDKFTCQMCGNTEKTLHVHHTRYFPKRDPWDYESNLLVTLCVDDHKQVSELKERIGAMLHFNNCAFWEGFCSRFENMNEDEHFMTWIVISEVLREPSMHESISLMLRNLHCERDSAYRRGLEQSNKDK